jgi:toxin ParE1/3/4
VAGRAVSAIWSPQARADLDEIWNYYLRVASKDTAEKITRGIGNVIAALEAHPLAGRLRDELRPGLRSFAASPHVIFYRVANDVPEIIRVLDGRQDIEDIFAGDTDHQ